jgi:hypothetical protein
MSKFRKMPVEIEARQWNGDWQRMTQWAISIGGGGNEFGLDADGTISVLTLEGVMTCQIGDWLIRSVKGEFYPCKPDIFAATYEPVA